MRNQGFGKQKPFCHRPFVAPSCLFTESSSLENSIHHDSSMTPNKIDGWGRGSRLDRQMIKREMQKKIASLGQISDEKAKCIIVHVSLQVLK